MKKLVSLVLVLVLILSLSATAFAVTLGTAPSDTSSSPYAANITELYNLGALNGLVDGSGHFWPTADCSRNSFAVMLYNLWGGRGIEAGWLNDTAVADQKWCCDAMRIVSTSLGHTVNWNGGTPTATVSRELACNFVIGMLNCNNELRRMTVANGGYVPGAPSTPTPSTPTPTDPGWPGDYYSPVCGFTDVQGGCWYADPVAWCLQQGVTTGTSSTTFSPDRNCTLAQVLTFLWRANGRPSVGSNWSCPFGGIPSNHYFYEAARWASSKGVIPDDKVNPDTALCTRAYLVWAMWKLDGSPSVSSDYYRGFQDVDSSASYRTAVGWALKHGITSGTSSTTFNPMGLLTRAEVVTFLYRAYGPHATR